MAVHVCMHVYVSCEYMSACLLMPISACFISSGTNTSIFAASPISVLPGKSINYASNKMFAQKPIASFIQFQISLAAAWEEKKSLITSNISIYWRIKSDQIHEIKKDGKNVFTYWRMKCDQSTKLIISVKWWFVT